MITTYGADAFDLARDRATALGHDMELLVRPIDPGRDALCAHCKGQISEFISEKERTWVQADDELEKQCCTQNGADQ